MSENAQTIAKTVSTEAISADCKPLSHESSAKSRHFRGALQTSGSAVSRLPSAGPHVMPLFRRCPCRVWMRPPTVSSYKARAVRMQRINAEPALGNVPMWKAHEFLGLAENGGFRARTKTLFEIGVRVFVRIADNHATIGILNENDVNAIALGFGIDSLIF